MPKTRALRVFCTAAALFAVGWAVFAFLLFPWTIEKTYHGGSLPILDHLMRGRASKPLAEYLDRWSRMADRLSFGFLIVGVYAGFAALGLAGKAALPVSKTAPEVPMSAKRRLVVYGLAAVIFGVTFLDLALSTDHWPFSRYEMYSELYLPGIVTTTRLYGVVGQSPLVEIQLDSNLYLRPFDTRRMSSALEYAYQNNRLTEALMDCLARYEALRRAGRHDGPRLVGMRAYRVTWTEEPSAGNIDQPDRKELLGEVAPRSEEGD